MFVLTLTWSAALFMVASTATLTTTSLPTSNAEVDDTSTTRITFKRGVGASSGGTVFASAAVDVNTGVEINFAYDVWAWMSSHVSTSLEPTLCRMLYIISSRRLCDAAMSSPNRLTLHYKYDIQVRIQSISLPWSGRTLRFSSCKRWYSLVTSTSTSASYGGRFSALSAKSPNTKVSTYSNRHTHLWM